MCVPWEADYSCCDEWDDYTVAAQDRAATLAWATLKVLSGFRVGNCPVTVRPELGPACDACSQFWRFAYDIRSAIVPPPRGVWGWSVATWDVGTWDGFGPLDDIPGCTCTDQPCEIILPGPVAVLAAVELAGTELPLEAFRVDNGNRIVRQDGQCFPNCQDMTVPLGDPDTLGITYVPGIIPDSAGLWAAGVLACEYAKACSGALCRLPAAVTSVARQGVTFTMSSGMFEGGQTGIREVDAYLISVNPNGLKIPPMVWSPDVSWAKHRYTTTTAIVTP